MASLDAGGMTLPTVRNYRYCYHSSELTVRPTSPPLLPANTSICGVNCGLFAGKRASTGICTDHKALLQRRNLWKRASTRRLTKERRHTFRQKKTAAPVERVGGFCRFRLRLHGIHLQRMIIQHPADDRRRVMPASHHPARPRRHAVMAGEVDAGQVDGLVRRGAGHGADVDAG